MVNRTFFLILSSKACTKSSFAIDNRPLHRSSCTFYCASLNSRNHLHTDELLMECSPYKSQSWRISAGFMLFTFKKKITDCISHAAGFSIFLNIINTARCVNAVQMSVNCIRALPQHQQTRHARAPSWPQCWITLVYGNVMLAHSSILTVCDNAGWIKERAWNVKEVFV